MVLGQSQLFLNPSTILPLCKPKFLIVDDDPDIMNGLKKRLHWLGHEVLTATDGTLALDQTLKEAQDLMLLDLEMPRLSGLDVLKELAERQSLADGHRKNEG